MRERRERRERWEVRQDREELLRKIDSLGTENSRLRRERDGAIRAGYTDREEAMVATNRLAARDADVKRLEALLEQLERNLAEGEEDELRQRILDLEFTISRSGEQYGTLYALHQAFQASFGELSQDNLALHEQIVGLHDVEEEAKGLRRENRSLSGRNKLLRSQVGSFMVGNRITTTQYLIQVARNIPLVGGLFRKTSEQVYDQTHPPSGRQR